MKIYQTVDVEEYKRMTRRLAAMDRLIAIKLIRLIRLQEEEKERIKNFSLFSSLCIS